MPKTIYLVQQENEPENDYYTFVKPEGRITREEGETITELAALKFLREQLSDHVDEQNVIGTEQLLCMLLELYQGTV